MKEHNQIQKVQRLDWLDVLKCIAMFIVLCGHVTQDRTPDTLRYYIYSFHMPLFFIISGMGYYLQTKNREYDFVGMLKNKTRTLLWPYFILNVLLIPYWIYNWKILNANEQSIKELIMAIFYSNQKWNALPTSTTWFITCLFLTVMLFFLVKWWAKNDEKLILLLCMVIGLIGYAMSLNPTEHFIYPWHMNTVPIGVMLFMFGYIFIKNIDFFDKILGNKWYHHVVWLVVMICGGYCCARVNVKVSMGVNSYGSFMLFIGAVVCFSMACYIVSRWIPSFGILKLIGRNTIIYLALHEQIYRTITFYNDTTNSLITNHPYLTATFVFIIIIPIAWIVEKWLPFLIGKKRRKFA